ncbi:MAG: hypothetical protein OEZ39_00010 [Gammaproteobacteria bacterium]|nr:hypothetical protein [Gammaproteobacteria bacterium]MDH5650230.1 hypothetical protein [Gammaproteobacteria bacterium]
MKAIFTLSKLTKTVALFTMLAMLLGVQGCIHDKKNANATGFYDSGSITELSVSDLQVMINGNRMILMSVATGLLYDGTITMNERSFTGTLTAFQGGVSPTSVTVSGVVIIKSKITGTITGGGVALDGSFTADYSTENAQQAAATRIDNVGNNYWAGVLYTGPNVHGFSIDNTGKVSHFDITITGPFSGCAIIVDTSNITPIAGTNMFTITVSWNTCDNAAVDGTYTGMVAIKTVTNSDDTLAVALSNSVAGVISNYSYTTF